MSILIRQSHADNVTPLWLSSSASSSTGPTGPTGPQGEQGFSSGAIYYFNENTPSDIPGYFEMSKTPSFTPASQATASADGLVVEFATPLGDPNVSAIPPGNWIYDLVMDLNVPFIISECLC
jgi:hypothetical protein